METPLLHRVPRATVALAACLAGLGACMAPLESYETPRFRVAEVDDFVEMPVPTRAVLEVQPPVGTGCIGPFNNDARLFRFSDRPHVVGYLDKEGGPRYASHTARVVGVFGEDGVVYGIRTAEEEAAAAGGANGTKGASAGLRAFRLGTYAAPEAGPITAPLSAGTVMSVALDDAVRFRTSSYKRTPGVSYICYVELQAVREPTAVASLPPLRQLAGGAGPAPTSPMPTAASPTAPSPTASASAAASPAPAPSPAAAAD